MNSLFYDTTISYEDNYLKGPPLAQKNITPPQKRKLTKKRFKFLGIPINFPFGIPAGPLLNSKFMKAAFDWGFDVSTYKTVRSEAFPCHPFPNILFVRAPRELHPDKTSRLVATAKTKQPKTSFSITNSFGVPSKKPEIWQKDVRRALENIADGQLLILSFMGTVRENQTQNEFVRDFAKAAKLAAQTGAKVLEANLSCPNIGSEGLVCYNLEVTEKVCRAIRRAIKDRPLILKVGYYKSDNDLQTLAKIADKYAQGIAAINTLAVEIVNKDGKQALPGKNRLKSGVCGAGIKWAGLTEVRKLNKIRRRNKYNFSIVGIGGVMMPKDYFEYRRAGADLVQSATGSMWNPHLAYQIWKRYNSH